MKLFAQPEIEIIKFGVMDVITSDADGNMGGTGGSEEDL